MNSLSSGEPHGADGAEHPERARQKESASSSSEPGLYQVLLFAVVMLTVCAVIAAASRGLWQTVAANFDNLKYIWMATAIEKGDLRLALPTRFCWGFPFAVAVVARGFRIGNVPALFVVSTLSSLTAMALACILWGPWVALYFNVVDYAWLSVSGYGSSDPLFVALTFASLLAARNKRYVQASVLGALGVLVRPVGVFLLPLLAIWALYDRGLRCCAFAVALSGLILGLYVWGMAHSVGDPLLTYHQYQQEDWGGGLPVTWPFASIVANFQRGVSTPKVYVRWGKLLLVAVHVVVLLTIVFIPAVRRRVLSKGLEAAFGFVYSGFLLIYNSPEFALTIYDRLALPVVPWLLWTLEPWLPKRWWVIGVLSAFSFFVLVRRFT